MTWILVITMCGLMEDGLKCHAFTTPRLFPAQEVCKAFGDATTYHVWSSPPEDVVLKFVKRTCLDIGEDT